MCFSDVTSSWHVNHVVKDLSLSLGSLKARAIGEMDESGVKQDVILFYAFWCSKSKNWPHLKAAKRPCHSVLPKICFTIFLGDKVGCRLYPSAQIGLRTTMTSTRRTTPQTTSRFWMKKLVKNRSGIFGIAMSRQEQSEKTCQYNTCHLYTCAHLSSQQFDYKVLHGFPQFSRDWCREVWLVRCRFRKESFESWHHDVYVVSFFQSHLLLRFGFEILLHCYIHLFWLAKKCGWQTAWDMQVGR